MIRGVQNGRPKHQRKTLTVSEYTRLLEAIDQPCNEKLRGYFQDKVL